MSRVAITIGSSGTGLAAAMDGRFGRAPRFLILDSDDREDLVVIDNPSVNAEHGAGTGAAALMRTHHVEAVISGRFGPKAAQALGSLGIQTLMAPPELSAGDALRLYREGKLVRAPGLQVFR